MPFLAPVAVAGTSAATAGAVGAAGVGVVGGSATAATIGAVAPAATSGFSLAALAPYASLVAGALGAFGAIQQGSSAAAQGGMQATLQQQQAERERQIGEQQSEDFRRQQSRIMASRRAMLGGSGVEAGAGSPLLVSEDMAGEIELQALRIRNNSAAVSSRLTSEAGLSRWAGRSEKRGSYTRAGASLLQGAAYSGFGRQ